MSDRLGKILAGTAAITAGAVGVVGTPDTAEAAVFSSGVVNIPIPANIDGVYLNVITGATGTSGSSVSGWDVNPYALSTGPAFFSPNTNATVASQHGVVGSGTTVTDIGPAGVVGPASTFLNGARTTSTFTPGVEGVLGFRFLNEAGGTVHYGYARIIPPSTSTAGIAGTIIEYAYEGTPNTAIAVPEPASLSLLALGAVGLLRRRSVA
jgi:hypothetical protein